MFLRLKFSLLIFMLSLCMLQPAWAEPEYWQAFQTEIPIQNTQDFQLVTPDRFRNFTLSMLGPRYQGIGIMRLSNGPIWDFGPHFSFGLLGELVYTNKDGESPNTEYRLLAEPLFKGKLGDAVSWVDRNWLEYRIFDTKTSWRYRNMLRLNWKLHPQWTPFVADEIFYDFERGFNQNRARIGVSYHFEKGTRLDVGYMARSRKSPDEMWSLDHILTVFVYFMPPATIKKEIQS